MNRRSFMTALAGLPIVGAVLFSKSVAKGGDNPPLPIATSDFRATVTLDGVEYELPCYGDSIGSIINTTGRVIPAGTLIHCERRPRSIQVG